MKQLFCCMCQEFISRKVDLELRYNPYYRKKKAYCKTCGYSSIIFKYRKE